MAANEWKITLAFNCVFILISGIVLILTFERKCKLTIWLICGIVLMFFVGLVLILSFVRHGGLGIHFSKSQNLQQSVSKPTKGDELASSNNNRERNDIDLCSDYVDCKRTLPRSFPIEYAKIALFGIGHFFIIGWCITGLSFASHEKQNCDSLLVNWSLAMASIWLFVSFASIVCATIWGYITFSEASQWSTLEDFDNCTMEWPSFNPSPNSNPP
eukprot:453475_1